MSDSERSLSQRIKDWLGGEGYPLEFETANEFRGRGFEVRQGEYVECGDGSPREVDVMAYVSDRESDLRVYNVIECKWSGDKPWVVFTSESQQISEAACVNQTISSQLGASITWALSGDGDVTNLALFRSPQRAGFGGRQALSKDNSDVFYKSVQSVIIKANSLVDRYDEQSDLSKRLPEWGALAFPTIVVKGGLFEAYLDHASSEVQVEERNQIRIHWRGSSVWRHHAIVDVVNSSSLTDFATVRARDTSLLVEKMKIARSNIELCWENRSLKELSCKPAARGTVGSPTVLNAILLRGRSAEKAAADA